MNQFLLYFRFEPYLAQWYIHEMGGTSPVELPRGSVEADILRLFLDKRPKDVPVDTGQDANLAIVIPAFKEKEAITYNYLDASAIHCLHSCIRSRFDVQLWQDRGGLDGEPRHRVQRHELVCRDQTLPAQT